jgi:GMP synthase-like glutamine amidotransferase
MRVIDDFYKVGYIYQEKQMWAVYFHLESAQEAMMKMIAKGVQVTGLESQKITRGDNIRGVHRTPRVRD